MSLEQVWHEGRLLRGGESERDEDGHGSLGLLAAIGGGGDDPETCPSSVAPLWVAHLLPWMDDSGTKAAWPGHIERLIQLEPHLHTLGRRAKARTLLTILSHVRTHASRRRRHRWEQAVAAVSELLKRVATSWDEPLEQEWVTTAADAWEGEAARSAAQAMPMSAEARSAAEVMGAAWRAVAEVAATTAKRKRPSRSMAAADAIISDILDVWKEELAEMSGGSQ